jgi:hypothetical protein
MSLKATKSGAFCKKNREQARSHRITENLVGASLLAIRAKHGH